MHTVIFHRRFFWTAKLGKRAGAPADCTQDCGGSLHGGMGRDPCGEVRASIVRIKVVSG